MLLSGLGVRAAEVFLLRCDPTLSCARLASTRAARWLFSNDHKGAYSACRRRAARGFTPGHGPHLAINALMRRRFSARHTSLNSAWTFFNPRRLNCLKPSTLLIHPLGASTIHFLLR